MSAGCALYTRSVCVACVTFHGLGCHPWPCIFLKLRFVADSIASAPTKFQWFRSPCAPSALCLLSPPEIREHKLGEASEENFSRETFKLEPTRFSFSWICVDRLRKAGAGTLKNQPSGPSRETIQLLTFPLGIPCRRPHRTRSCVFGNAASSILN